MPNIQLRVTLPWEQVVDALNDGDYLTRCDAYMVFEHPKDEKVSRTHTHVYMFNHISSRIDDNLRDFFQKRGLPKSDYMASRKCKKGQIDPMKAYQYGTTCNLFDIKTFNGFTEEQLKSFQKSAEEYYDALKKQSVDRITIIEKVEQKPDLVWNRFFEKMLRSPEVREYSLDQFKRWIMADYLNRCKPIPRTADLNRYAFSLWMLKDKTDDNKVRMEEVPLNLH